MKLHFIDEPELEFGGAGRHIDIRHGLAEHGPLDRGLPAAPQAVRLGVVGSAKDVENFRAWVDRCRGGIDAKRSHRNTLFVAFDGFGESRPLCDFIVDDRLTDIISGGDMRRIGEAHDAAFAAAASDRYRQGAADLIDKGNANVVACLLTDEFVRRIDVPEKPERGPRSRRSRETERAVWHDAFKADTLNLARPVQLVRPGTYGGGVYRYRRDGRSVRDLQDEATRRGIFSARSTTKRAGSRGGCCASRRIC